MRNSTNNHHFHLSTKKKKNSKLWTVGVRFRYNIVVIQRWDGHEIFLWVDLHRLGYDVWYDTQERGFLFFFIFFINVYFLVCAGMKKVFPCLACGKVLCSKASLKRHVADKHASRQEEYRCAICERVYCSRNSLMTHIYTYHKTRPTMLLPPPPHHAPPPPTTHSDVKF